MFNRSHYEDVLVPRVHHLVDESVWRARYGLINAFEQTLADGATTVVKCFLHVSFAEQGKRLRRRLEEPDKRWKAQAGDFMEREHWDAYQAAYAELLAQTSTEAAPWFIIPADHKWYRNWVVSQVLLHTLETIDPRYPDPPPLDLPDEAWNRGSDGRGRVGVAVPAQPQKPAPPDPEDAAVVEVVFEPDEAGADFSAVTTADHLPHVSVTFPLACPAVMSSVNV